MVLTALELLARLTATRPERHGDYLHFAFPALEAQGTLLFRAPSLTAAAGFWGAALRWLSAFEAHISRSMPTSFISQINAAAGNGVWFEFDAEIQELFVFCDWFHWKTGGVFDPTVSAAEQLWDAASGSEPDAAALTAARELVGWHKLIRTPGKVRLPRAGMQLDLDDIGQAFAVDHLFTLAQKHGIRDILVTIAQHRRAGGRPPKGGDWSFDIEQPGQPDTLWNSVTLNNAALACSADYHNAGGGPYHNHLVDPRSGKPTATGIHTAWAIAPTCTEASILANVACILGLSDSEKLYDQTPGAAACLWSDEGMLQTRRFQRYEIKKMSLSA
ncbi:MAG: FAD:protein FMN transferase [Kiritimatiellaeota bacterium]|nr:FAD:protein FMN transferase [Kiritimatiellota bacterium]